MPPEKQISSEKNKVPKQVIRTYQDDLADAQGVSRKEKKIASSPLVVEDSKRVQKENNISTKIVPQKFEEASIDGVTFKEPELSQDELRSEEKEVSHHIESLQKVEPKSLQDTLASTQVTISEGIPTPPPSRENPFRDFITSIFDKRQSKKQAPEIQKLPAIAPVANVIEAPTVLPKKESFSSNFPSVSGQHPVAPILQKKPFVTKEAVQNVVPLPIPPQPTPETQSSIQEIREKLKQAAPIPAPMPLKAPVPMLPPMPEIVSSVQEVKKKLQQAPKIEKPDAPKKEIFSPSPLHTFTTDAQKGIKGRHDSKLSLLAKEQDSRSHPPKRHKKQSFSLVLISILFIVGGASALGGAYYFLSLQKTPVAQPARVVSPVFVDSQIRISATAVPTLSGLAEILSEVSAPALGTLTQIILEKTDDTNKKSFITLDEVLRNSSEVPGALARSTLPQSMLGIFDVDKKPVFILSVTSFPQAFKSMLSWEDTIPKDLESLYGTYDDISIASSTESAIPFSPHFIDETLGVFDVRTLYDINGIPYLTYGFINPTLLFIAPSPDIFVKLSERIVRQ